MTYVIIVNWNGFQITVETIQSLFELESDCFRIIVCDNDSSDCSYEKLYKTFYKNKTIETRGGIQKLCYQHSNNKVILNDCFVTLVQTGSNLGYAGANNIGIRVAQKMPQKCTAIWIINNDIMVDSRALLELEEYSKNIGHSRILGSVLLEHGTKKQVQMAGGNLIKLLGVPKKNKKGMSVENLSSIQEVDYVSGASLFLHSSLLDLIGYMDEDYFLYWEETDWCFRARELTGLRPHCVTDSLVWHKDGGSIGKYSVLQQRIDSINMVRFYKKFFPYIIIFPILLKPIVNQLALWRLSNRKISRFLSDYFWEVIGLTVRKNQSTRARVLIKDKEKR